MSIIIKLQGLPLEANAVDVRLYFLGLTIPDGGVHIIGGDEGTVFIEFANDEDARQAMARGFGAIKNSSIKLLLSSKSEMQSVIDSVRQRQQQNLAQQPQQQSQPPPPAPQQQQQQQPFQQPLLLPQVPQPWFNVPVSAAPAAVPLLPWIQPIQQQQHPLSQQQQQQQQQQLLPPRPTLLLQNQTLQPNHDQQLQQQQTQPQQQQFNQTQNQNSGRVRGISGMRGGDDKLFADKRCVLAASNIPYRATSKDIIEFLSDFDIREECIRRRYNQKGQPTADAKIAFPSHDAAMKALKVMNKKLICGRPVFLKPV